MASLRISPPNAFGESLSFNLTPVIDIVFQLIIFFSVTCRFIEAENFPVQLPAPCSFAQSGEQPNAQLTTVTVMKEEGSTIFAVGPERVAAGGFGELAEKVVGLLNGQLEKLPADKRVVTLRIDKDVPFYEAQYALAAVAASTATDIRIAALKEDSPLSSEARRVQR